MVATSLTVCSFLRDVFEFAFAISVYVIDSVNEKCIKETSVVIIDR